jgi:putative ABC transport system permease protein
VRLAPLATAIAVGFDTLRVNPLRTILSTLGVIIGVSALVAVLSVGDGMERSVRSQIEESTDLQAITINSRTSEEVDGQLFPLPNPVHLTADDARRIRAIEGIKEVTLRAPYVGEVRNSAGTTRRMAAFLAEVAFRDTSRLKASTGRLLMPDEAAGSTPVVVVSDDLARSFAPDSNAAALVGDSILVGTLKAQVVGVLEPAAAPQVPMSRRRRGDYRVLAPFEFARSALPGPAQPPIITAQSATVEHTQAVKARIEQSLAAGDHAWQKHYRVTTNEMRLEQLSRGILMFKLFMGAITGISLLVGGRHHERALVIGDGADARNRHQEGHRRPRPRHQTPVPRRIGRDFSGWKWNRPGNRHRRSVRHNGRNPEVLAGALSVRVGFLEHARSRCCRGVVDRADVRNVSSSPGGSTESD